ncbi:FFLEELY motif protein [Wenzhouxiangella marina]|uniref:DUF8198 domain-containing protein n=1 Tax=Wenzhouxiangella marina TaxID=1579979 RepID=A0A0K0XWV2_9GAMM|nr:hypothetical protein [Wenzhouxiangella marina]AKS42158.1 hypothetical protein WM2015_1791 [Wenzhouxiangella marina]MBB6086070.1 hypothetical protein [Wenzhouxiangella marina]
MSHAEAIEHLSEQIRRNQAVGERLARAEPELEASLIRLQDWQRRRLDATYADLRRSERHRPACEFFLDELYGGRDFRERDRQLARVVPVMRRFLPDHLLMAVGDAMRLQAVSLEFDLDLAEVLVAVEAMDQPAYAAAYRSLGTWQGRREQIELIEALGRVLDETVHRPMVHRLVRMMQGPAVLAGFGALQGFLRRGLDAFAKMQGADHFLHTIISREMQALEAMEAGDEWPFATWIGRGPAD